MKTGTREWSDVSYNIQNGCDNDCLYCYAKANAIRFKQATVESWKTPVLKEPPFGHAPHRKRVMFPTTHDITSGNVEYSIVAIGSLLDKGNKVLVVTKANTEAIYQIVDYFNVTESKENLEFRVTIGSPHDYELIEWEPNAPGYLNRLKSLRLLHKNGFKTSVSAEPLLCVCDAFPVLYREVRPYITEGIWVGKMNNCLSRVRMNTGSFEHDRMVRELMDDQCDENIIALYERYKDDPLVRWKDSIRKVVGI